MWRRLISSEIHPAIGAAAINAQTARPGISHRALRSDMVFSRDLKKDIRMTRASKAAPTAAVIRKMPSGMPRLKLYSLSENFLNSLFHQLPRKEHEKEGGRPD